METLALSFIFIKKNTIRKKYIFYNEKKDKRRKGRGTEGAIAQRKSRPTRKGGSEYKLIFGIHVDVGRYRMKASMHI